MGRPCGRVGMIQKMTTAKHSELEVRRQKVADLVEAGHNPYPNGIAVTHLVEEILGAINENKDLDGLSASFQAAGRVMAINRFGKSAFIRFRDRTGQMQAYVRNDKVGQEAYDLFRKFDVGDFVVLSGSVFQTKTGEWTILAEQLELVCKAVRPLPEKFHGVKDPEKRYRRRYVDLIVNDDVRDLFLKRSRIIQAVREVMLQHDFLEVETPMMQPMAGGAEATPFATHHNALDMSLYLRIAPELYLKRLVVGGFERVFEINRNFRNEGVSTKHNPEFTMMEFYQAYATYEDLMAFTEEMFLKACQVATGGESQVVYQDHTLDFSGPFHRITLTEALTTIGGIDPEALNDKEALLKIAADKGIRLDKAGRWGKIVMKLFDILVEPNLIQPTFITGYPVEVSPLSRRSDTQPELTDRFELFIAGLEVANGFSELNDPEDQRSRFAQQVEDRKAGDKEAHQMDHDYIEALEYGMPPTAGEGVGIDRLVMLLTNAASIREVILFPHMRREEEPGKTN